MHQVTEALQMAAQKLLEVLPDNGNFENWSAWRVYLPRTTALLENTGINMETIEVASLCYLLADYLYIYHRV